MVVVILETYIVINVFCILYHYKQRRIESFSMISNWYKSVRIVFNANYSF